MRSCRAVFSAGLRVGADSVAWKAPKPDQVARVRARADELSVIVLSAPGVLADAEDFPFLEGVLLVARAERGGARIVPKKQDSS